MSVEDVWAEWWRLLINEDHEAQAVEMFLCFYDSEQADLLGWLAGDVRRRREKAVIVAEAMAEMESEIRQLKGLPPLDRAAG